MSNFDYIKNMSVEDLSVFLDSLIDKYEPPWSIHFQENYCNKCESIKKSFNGRIEEYCYCELNDYRCQKNPEVNSLDSAIIVKIWLNSDFEEKRNN